MIINAYVTHPAPASAAGCSDGAITVSRERICARYAAAVDSNGEQVEFSTSRSIEEIIRPRLIQHLSKESGSGKGPRIFTTFAMEVYKHVIVPIFMTISESSRMSLQVSDSMRSVFPHLDTVYMLD